MSMGIARQALACLGLWFCAYAGASSELVATPTIGTSQLRQLSIEAVPGTQFQHDGDIEWASLIDPGRYVFVHRAQSGKVSGGVQHRVLYEYTTASGFSRAQPLPTMESPRFTLSEDRLEWQDALTGTVGRMTLGAPARPREHSSEAGTADTRAAQAILAQARLEFLEVDPLRSTPSGGYLFGRVRSIDQAAVSHHFIAFRETPAAGMSFALLDTKNVDGELYVHAVIVDTSGLPVLLVSTGKPHSTLMLAKAKVNPNVSLTVNPVSTTFGNSVTLVATVTGQTPTGNISFLDGTTTLSTKPLSGGSATFATAGLSVATHSIKANYAGDANNNPATSAVKSVVIAKASSTTTLSIPANPTYLGQTAQFTATVVGNAPSGNVRLRNAGTQIAQGALSSGAFNFNIASLAVGTHSLSAEYVGDGNNATSVSAVRAFTVQAKTNTSTQLTAPRNAIRLGQAHGGNHPAGPGNSQYKRRSGDFTGNTVGGHALLHRNLRW
jgi:Bacterial Ig-like domain (group 3)